MKDYYESLWERLPSELAPPEFELRRRFLLGELRPRDRVLDLGCGAGEFTAAVAEALTAMPGRAASSVSGSGGSGGSVLGAEVAEAALRRARAAHPDLSFELIPFDGPLPWADCSFDLIWASEVIEHVADTARWLSEVRRVLAPAGRLLLTTPAHGRLRLLLGGIERYSEPLGDHLHLYTARSLRVLLGEFGFGETRVWAASGPPALRRTLFARAVRT